MQISNLQQQLEDFKKFFGDVEIEFWFDIDDESDPKELELKKLHDGYNQSDSRTETICEIKFEFQPIRRQSLI